MISRSRKSIWRGWSVLPPTDRFRSFRQTSLRGRPRVGEEDAIRLALCSVPISRPPKRRSAPPNESRGRARRTPALAGAQRRLWRDRHQPRAVTRHVYGGGQLRIPIWQGGKTEGDIEQAVRGCDAAARRTGRSRRASGKRSRNAYLDLEAAASQVEVARKNLDVNQRDARSDAAAPRCRRYRHSRCRAGHRPRWRGRTRLHQRRFRAQLAKLSLARAAGATAENLNRYLPLP